MLRDWIGWLDWRQDLPIIEIVEDALEHFGALPAEFGANPVITVRTPIFTKKRHCTILLFYSPLTTTIGFARQLV